MDITIFNVEIDLLAVFVATIASIVIGTIYYNPMVVGKYWMDLVNIKSKDIPKGMITGMAISFVLSFATFMVVAFFWPTVEILAETGEYEAAALTGFMVWLPTFYTTAMHNSYAQRRKLLTLIDTLYVLVSLITGALAIAIIS